MMVFYAYVTCELISREGGIIFPPFQLLDLEFKPWGEIYESSHRFSRFDDEHVRVERV